MTGRLAVAMALCLGLGSCDDALPALADGAPPADGPSTVDAGGDAGAPRDGAPADGPELTDGPGVDGARPRDLVSPADAAPPVDGSAVDGSAVDAVVPIDLALVLDLEPDADQAPPETRITGGPSGAVASRSATFTFEADEQPVRFECRLDSGSFGDCQSPATYANLAVGPHTFAVRAIDAADNVDPTPATRTWAVRIDPILHYPFDGSAVNVGTLGASYDGLVTNATFAPGGKVGEAVVFEGSAASFVLLPNTRIPLSAGSSYTIALWFNAKTTSDRTSLGTLLDFRLTGNDGGGIVCFGEDPQVAKLSACYSASPSGADCGSFDFVEGDWHHLILRYAATSTQPGGGAPLEIYRDGMLVDTAPNATGAVIFSAGQDQNMVLGAGSDFIVDDLKIYDSVFSEAEQCSWIIGGSWTGSCQLP